MKVKIWGKKVKGAVSMGWIMGVVLGVVMFTALIGVIADQSTYAMNMGNITGAADVLIGLTTVIVVIIFFAKLVGRR